MHCIRRSGIRRKPSHANLVAHPKTSQNTSGFMEQYMVICSIWDEKHFRLFAKNAKKYFTEDHILLSTAETNIAPNNAATINKREKEIPWLE
jgi:hypothetical protein